MGVLMLWFFSRRTHQSLRTPVLRLHLTRSFLGCLSIVLWFYTLSRMNFGTCMTLIYTTPLFMAANFAILALRSHTRAPWGLIIPTITGFIGITIILQPSINENELIPALICLFVSFIDLIVYWQMKKMGETKEPSWRIVFYFTLFSTLFAVAGTLLFEGGFHVPDTQATVGLIGMGVFATLGQMTSTRSYAYGNLLLSSLLGFSAIPFSLLMGVVLFEDPLSWVAILGMAIILVSGLFATVSTKRAEQAEKAAKAAQAAP